MQNFRTMNTEQQSFEERVIQVNRVSKKTSGGNKIGFSVLIVVGNRQGSVGAGLGKAVDVASAVRKGSQYARKHQLTVILKEGRTLQHEQRIKYGAADLLLKPAPRGSGIIAGGAVRTVLELAGVKDVVAKMLGSRNKITNIYATLEALQHMRTTNTRMQRNGTNK
ncbi:30S ribosomal protein S5 [Candidatus Roizmanbacteria bacterium]|nr:30S ribosomal protein S5 [Candidatus Roizmanbacteria bacterium]